MRDRVQFDGSTHRKKTQFYDIERRRGAYYQSYTIRSRFGVKKVEDVPIHHQLHDKKGRLLIDSRAKKFYDGS